MFAVPTFAADYSGEDPQLEKNIKILTIWAEDNDNGMLLNKICEDYQKNVNPNFTWEYEMVASDNLQQKIATLAASNDLPDLFAYEAGAPLSVLIDSGKVKNITEAVDEIGTADYLNSGAVELLKGLSGTDDLYDLPLGLNVEGFWYNKALFEQAGCEVPTTWDETRFIDGYPGKYVVLARRHGDTWYLAAVNAGKEIVKLKLDLDMFAGKIVSLYKDDKKGEPQLVTLKVKESGKVQLEILPQGGVVLVNN